jgi:hypothetical protein
MRVADNSSCLGLSDDPLAIDAFSGEVIGVVVN